jgi:hypothetical protein
MEETTIPLHQFQANEPTSVLIPAVEFEIEISGASPS